jgi:tetratricopeptide (TPR) repeat protein
MDSNLWNNKGNVIFKSVCNDAALAPVVYQNRMSEALQFYNKALASCYKDEDRASILRNIAATQFRIGNRLYGCLQWNVASRTKVEEISYFLEQSLESYGKALAAGEFSKDARWKAQVEEKGTECVDFIWQFVLEDPQYRSDNEDGGLSQLIGRINQICLKTDGYIRGKLFFKLGRLSLQKAVQYQENGDHKEALHLLKGNYTPVEEAKQHLGLLEDVTDLEYSTSIHLSIAESAMARERGELAWKSATQDNERLEKQLVWDAVDHYNQAIILAREKCLESEAMAHSQLGQLYEALGLADNSKGHYKAAVDLVQVLQPRNFNDRTWYKKCLSGLKKYQDRQKRKEQKEQEALRAPIKEELKDVLNELKAASAKSAEHFLNFIYTKHPPKNGTSSTDGELKVIIRTVEWNF